jgi:hypothetical protein
MVRESSGYTTCTELRKDSGGRCSIRCFPRQDNEARFKARCRKCLNSLKQERIGSLGYASAPRFSRS